MNEHRAHTPGPWFARRVSAKSATWLVVSADVELGPCVAVDGGADAHLIAAAPDMLAQLQDLVEAADVWAPSESALADSIKDARAIIAKATGLQP